MLKATMPALTALLTTKAEAWPVRVYPPLMRRPIHVTRLTPPLNGGQHGVGMDDAERVLELLLVVWSRAQLAESHYAFLTGNCPAHHQD